MTREINTAMTKTEFKRFLMNTAENNELIYGSCYVQSDAKICLDAWRKDGSDKFQGYKYYFAVRTHGCESNSNLEDLKERCKVFNNVTMTICITLNGRVYDVKIKY